MRVVSLNIWGGIVNNPLLDFVRTHSNDTDIFAFQEVFSSDKEFIEPTTGAVHHVLRQLVDSLPGHQCHYFPAQTGPGMDANFYPEMLYGLAIFTKNYLNILDFGDIFVYGSKDSYKAGSHFSNLSRNMAYVTVKLGEERVNIYNLHGLWNGRGKGDSDERIAQSRKAKDFINSRQGPVILCGDFNLLPDTESIRILEKGMTNLISSHDITSTRTSLYKKEPKFADYALVSPEIRVNEFKVLPDVVSDHSPLYLDFDV